MVSLKIYVGYTPRGVEFKEEYAIKNIEQLSAELVARGTEMAQKYGKGIDDDIVLCLSINVDGLEYPVWIFLHGFDQDDPFMSFISKMNPDANKREVTESDVEPLVVFYNALSGTYDGMSTEDVLYDAIRGGVIKYPDLPDTFKDNKMVESFLFYVEMDEEYDMTNLRNDVFVRDYEYLMNTCADRGLWKCLVRLLEMYDIKFGDDTLQEIVHYSKGDHSVIHDKIPNGFLHSKVLKAFGFDDIQPCRLDIVL